MELRYNNVLRATGITTLLTLAVLTGCGDDASSEGDGKGNDVTGAGEGTKDAGKEETDAGDDGAFRCGSDVCVVSQLAAPCCTVEGAGKAGDPNELTGRGANLCGADLSAFVEGDAYVCMQTNQPGKLDATCPAFDSPGGKLEGCCTDEGFCGGMEMGIPLGCVYGEGGRGTPCTK